MIGTRGRRLHKGADIAYVSNPGKQFWNLEIASSNLGIQKEIACVSNPVITCEDVWVLGIRRHNLLETFSNFYHSLHMQHDTSTSFMVFGLRMDFI